MLLIVCSVVVVYSVVGGGGGMVVNLFSAISDGDYRRYWVVVRQAVVSLCVSILT